MVEDPALTREAAARLRRAVGILSRQLRATPAAGGLTATQLSVLTTVIRRGPIGLSALSDIERLNPTMLSRVIAGLVDHRLVVRATSDSDRRAARVDATDRARTLRRRIQDERNDTLQAAMRRLTADQRDALDAALPVLEHLAETITRPR